MEIYELVHIRWQGDIRLTDSLGVFASKEEAEKVQSLLYGHKVITENYEPEEDFEYEHEFEIYTRPICNSIKDIAKYWPMSVERLIKEIFD